MVGVKLEERLCAQHANYQSRSSSSISSSVVGSTSNRLWLWRSPKWYPFIAFIVALLWDVRRHTSTRVGLATPFWDCSTQLLLLIEANWLESVCWLSDCWFTALWSRGVNEKRPLAAGSTDMVASATAFDVIDLGWLCVVDFEQDTAGVVAGFVDELKIIRTKNQS